MINLAKFSTLLVTWKLETKKGNRKKEIEKAGNRVSYIFFSDETRRLRLGFSEAQESASDPSSSEANIPNPNVDETSSSASLKATSSAAAESSDPSSEPNVPYALTSDELIFKALETVYEDGTGLDADAIFKIVEENFDVLDDFREQMEDQLGDLLAEGEIQKIGNRYRIRPGYFDAPKPIQTTSAGDSTSAPTDTPSTSSASVPKAPEGNPQIDAALKEVAEAEQLELKAREAQELADKHAHLLKFESNVILNLAEEIRNRCNVHLFNRRCIVNHHHHH
ncbi:hypothetical protein CARUB_v10011854mg [Capsella rubella]|uniref:H15 domain-containing protein n=1 Tax=Capsella rubella TaxID=81985 RepID=R0IIB8_9BRAS|nr:hypothetical protein CARUB_v10011854mg [Capsella rubella]